MFAHLRNSSPKCLGAFPFPIRAHSQLEAPQALNLFRAPYETPKICDSSGGASGLLLPEHPWDEREFRDAASLLFHGSPSTSSAGDPQDPLPSNPRGKTTPGGGKPPRSSTPSPPEMNIFSLRFRPRFVPHIEEEPCTRCLRRGNSSGTLVGPRKVPAAGGDSAVGGAEREGAK